MTRAQAEALKPGDTVLVKTGKGNPKPAKVICTTPVKWGIDITYEVERAGQMIVRSRLHNIVYLPAPDEIA